MRAGLLLLWFCGALAAQTVESELRRDDFVRFPQALGFGYLLQHGTPNLVLEPPDYAGLSSSRLPVISADAASWTATQFRWNGALLWDPYQPGRLLFLPDPAVIETATIRQGLAPARVSTYGPELAVEIRRPEDRWHAELSTAFTGNRLASLSTQPAVREPGLLMPDHFRSFNRTNVQLSGPIRRWLRVLLSASGQWAEEAGQANTVAPADVRLQFGNAMAWLYPSGKDVVSGGFTGTRIDRSAWERPPGLEPFAARANAPPIRPLPQLGAETHLDVAHLRWQRQAFQLHYAYSTAHEDAVARRDRSARETPRIDLMTGSVLGPPPIENFAVRVRHQAEASGQIAGWHLGGGLLFNRSKNRWKAPLHEIVAGDVGVSTVRWNTPVDVERHTQVAFAWLERQWPLASWLELNTGAHLDYSRGGPIRSAYLSPRTGLVLTPVGWLRLYGSYARYVHRLPARWLDFDGPDGLSGVERSANGSIIRRFGSSVSTIDPDLKRPYAVQVTAGAGVSLPFGIRWDLHLFDIREKRRVAAVNIGDLRFSERTILDPGGDFQTGTFDDRTLGVFAQDPATFGQDRFLLTNPAGLNHRHRGFTTSLTARRSRVWARFAFTAEKSLGPTNPGNEFWDNDPLAIGALFSNPNASINATGRTFFDRAYVGKAQGYAPLPLGIDWGNSFHYMDGLVFGRRLLVDGLPQGPTAIFATVRGSPEGGHRTEYVASWDTRLSRQWRLGTISLRLSMDLYNVLNARNHLREAEWSGPEFNQRLPWLVQPPRMAFFSLQLRY